MDAHKAIITNIFNNSTLIEVPFFQRSYVWKADLWARMIEDMEYIVKTNKPHFFGSIILKEGRRPHPGENFTDCRTIVDGQQRLTTFLLFMKVLCLKLGQSTTFDCQFRIMGQSIALRHGRNDIEAFERVMASTSADKIDNPAPQSRIIEAYNYFVDHIDENKNSLEYSTLKQSIAPRNGNISVGAMLVSYPTFSNGITLHRLSSGGSGGSGSGLAVAVSMKPPIFSAAPLCISLVMCV